METSRGSGTRNPGARWWLPNEDERYKAAYYDPDSVVYYDYPTGTNNVPDNVLPANDTGNSANYSNPTNPTGSSDFPHTDAGAYSLSGSPYGTFDQGGNVAEWNETMLAADSFRGLRGGSVINFYGELHASIANAIGIVPEDGNKHVGFRVATLADLPCDFNHDGTVHAADYVVWGKKDGTQPGYYDTWRAHFGETVGSGASGNASANAAVPEAATLVLLILAACIGNNRRRNIATVSKLISA